MPSLSPRWARTHGASLQTRRRWTADVTEVSLHQENAAADACICLICIEIGFFMVHGCADNLMDCTAGRITGPPGVTSELDVLPAERLGKRRKHCALFPSRTAARHISFLQPYQGDLLPVIGYALLGVTGPSADITPRTIQGEICSWAVDARNLVLKSCPYIDGSRACALRLPAAAELLGSSALQVASAPAGPCT